MEGGNRWEREGGGVEGVKAGERKEGVGRKEKEEGGKWGKVGGGGGVKKKNKKWVKMDGHPCA
jgi:hypothetical protein